MSKRKTRRKNIKRAKRSKTWMLAQRLEPASIYNWSSGKYSDKNIVNKAKKFSNSSSKAYSVKNKFHYIYVIYQKYYWNLRNEFQHKFDDYKYIFNSKQSDTNRSLLVGLHLMMRISFYYFIDGLNNAKRYSRKGRKPRLPKPPKIAWVLHDKDISKTGGIVKPHLHFAFKFTKQVSAKQLSRWSGIQPQYFESKYKGRYAYGNMLAYLIHAQQPSKHQYSPKSVHATFDYQTYARNHKVDWVERSAQVENKENSKGIDWLEYQVLHNPYMTKHYIIQHEPLLDIMASKPRYIGDINNLFDLKASVVADNTETLLREHKMQLSVFFIWGRSGVGKTTQAWRLIHKLQVIHPDWSVYQTAQSTKSSTHPLDDYSGEPILFMDEARNTDLPASTWLSVLDDNSTTNVSARYHNKKISSRVVIITTTEDPIAFFGYMGGIHQDEPLTQFLRRIGADLHLIELGNGHREIDYKRIEELPNMKSMEVTYGSSSDLGGQESKATRYIPYPTKPNIVTTSQATSMAVKEVNRNNDSSISHRPGARPLIPSSVASSLVHSASASASASLSNYENDLKNRKYF